MSSFPTETRAVRVLGTGHALPTNIVTSEALDHSLNLPLGTVQKVGGIRQRHFASREETAAKLAAQAARAALEAAGLKLCDVDCLVAASATMDQGLPCNAALIHRELGLSASAIPAFDVNASCLGFLAALDVMAWPIVAGRYRHVLVVAADIASCGLNWEVLEASAIFGDGAAAAVFGQSANEHSRILATALSTISEGADLCQIPAGGSRYHPTRTDLPFDALSKFHMDGKGVFKLASVHLPAFVDQLLARAGLTRDQLDWIVPHQASHLALQHLSKRLGFAPEKIINIFADHGNQVAASLPTAFDIGIRDGRIERGHRLLLLGTGAGLSMGGVVMEY